MSSSPPAADKEDLPRIWVKPYYGSFNGIRGFAVLVVFLQHYGQYLPITGLTAMSWAGVDLFFVLSGFLITGILYDSLDDPHYFRNFYIRRSLRIFPVFYGFFLLVLIATPILHLHFDRLLWSFIFYFGNLVTPFVGDIAHHNPTVISVMYHGHVQEVANIGPLWSLCVEEQFYLIWPAVVWWVRDRKRLMYLCGALCVVVPLGRTYIAWHATQQSIDQFLLYWSTYTRFDTLLAGAFLALWLRQRPLTRAQLRTLSLSLFCPSAVALGVGLFLSWPFSESIYLRWMATAGYSVIAIACAGILLWSLDERSLISRFFQNRALTSLGVVSYGFYFFHGLPRAIWFRWSQLHHRWEFLIPFVQFAIALTLAKLSFRYYEGPILKLKSVLAPQRSVNPGNPDAAPARLHVSEPHL